MRAWASVVCASCLTLAVSPVGASEGLSTAVKRVDVPVFEGGEGLDFFIRCAAEYSAAHPGVQVDLYGDPRIADKVRVRVLERSFPEITNAGINYWPLIYNGDILALDEYLDGPNWEEDSTWRESFLPGSLDRYQWEGKTYGIPLAYFVFVFWYNKAMFAEHGWRPPVTWDEFFALCEQIKSAGIPPIAFQGRYHGYAQALIDAGYYHLAGPDRWFAQTQLEPGSFANPEFEEALGLVQKTAVNYFQPGCMGMSHTEAQMQFFLGKTAMIPCGSWLKSEMLGKIPEGFQLGAFNLPRPRETKADPTAVTVGSNYYFVFTYSRHPEEAVDFLRFMTSREMAGLFSEMRDIVTAVRGASEGRTSPDQEDLLRIVNRARTAYGQPAGEGFPEMNQYWDDNRYGLLTGALTPAQAAANLEAGAEAVRAHAADPDAVTVRHIWQPLALLAILAAAIAYSLVTAIRRARLARQDPEAGREAGLLRMRWSNVLLFVGPAIVLYTVFVTIPCIKSFAWSLNRWNGITEMQFVGLQNFERLLFESDGFWQALRNNLFIMFVIPCFVLPLSLFFAACISRGVLGSRFFRIVFFFPNILGGVTATLLWMHLYNPQGGPVNEALVGLGHASRWVGEALASVAGQSLGGWALWLADRLEGFRGFAWLSPDHLYWALVPMSVWGACGFNMVLFLAAMESVPQSLYEAADLDGASHWRQFWTITLPLIWEVLAVAIVFMVIGGMKAFEIIWLLTNQAPPSNTHVIGTKMVSAMFMEFKVGEATAIAVLLFLLVFFGTAATLRVMRRERVEY